jgi:ABC-type antimicrobial peptide transport system permease subunit
MIQHVAPQRVASFVIITTDHLGAIFIEAALSSVRRGAANAELGSILVGVPGTAITVTILAVNLFGDALRDFLDPKLK